LKLLGNCIEVPLKSMTPLRLAASSVIFTLITAP